LPTQTSAKYFGLAVVP